MSSLSQCLKGCRCVSGSARMCILAAIAGSALWALAGASASQPSQSLREQCLSPIEMALSPDGDRLYVVCQQSNEVRVVSALTRKVISVIRVGHSPRGITLSSDGRRSLSPIPMTTQFPSFTERRSGSHVCFLLGLNPQVW